jgi:hypothetical protein
MTEFSDSTNFYIILTIFFAFYVYLRFVRIQIISTLSWKDVKCNPFYLLVGGMFDDNEAQKTFDKCIKNSAKEELYEKHNKNMQDSNKKVDEYIEQLQSNVASNDANVKKRHEGLLELINDSNRTVEDVIQRQDDLNEVIVEGQVPLSNLFSQIGELSNKFKDTMSKFLNSNLVSDLGED